MLLSQVSPPFYLGVPESVSQPWCRCSPGVQSVVLTSPGATLHQGKWETVHDPGSFPGKPTVS